MPPLVSGDLDGGPLDAGLLADTAIFARAGTVSFHDLEDENERPLRQLKYSMANVRRGSFSIDADFADGEHATIESKCVPFF